MNFLEKIDIERLPKHVAIIMDGNGRWAKSKGKDRSYGHIEGVASVRQVIEAAREVGISYLTLYTFSKENWNRPKEEIHQLMGLLFDSIENETPDLIKNGVSLEIIGDISQLPENVKNKALKCVSDTSCGKKLKMILALSYSSKWEIIEAVKKIALDVKSESLSVEDINSEYFGNCLQTKSYPDPDLLIRTGGEKRISNFLLWQLAYTELYFTEKAWPDFKKEEFYEAIYSYQHRERRFGKTSEQIAKSENK